MTWFVCLREKGFIYGEMKVNFMGEVSAFCWTFNWKSDRCLMMDEFFKKIGINFYFVLLYEEGILYKFLILI